MQKKSQKYLCICLSMNDRRRWSTNRRRPIPWPGKTFLRHSATFSAWIQSTLIQSTLIQFSLMSWRGWAAAGGLVSISATIATKCGYYWEIWQRCTMWKARWQRCGQFRSFSQHSSTLSVNERKKITTQLFPHQLQINTDNSINLINFINFINLINLINQRSC